MKQFVAARRKVPTSALFRAYLTLPPNGTYMISPLVSTLDNLLYITTFCTDLNINSSTFGRLFDAALTKPISGILCLFCHKHKLQIQSRLILFGITYHIALLCRSHPYATILDMSSVSIELLINPTNQILIQNVLLRLTKENPT